ncbi:MAG: hypothetical protein ABSA68_16715 [Xanthobacteraceae bacterium]
MAARIGAGFRLGVAAALLLLLAVAGGGYYYAVYAPPVAAPDNARALEQARAEALKRVAQQRLLAQQQEQEQRAAAQRQAAKAAAQAAYQACLTGAATRDASQAAECKRLADKTAADRADCLGKLKLPQAYCEASYPARDAAPDCTLPAEIATVLDAAVERARYRCERESKAAE